MCHYYADVDHHASQSSGSLVEISNSGQVTGFLPSDSTSTSFKDLVNQNVMLESKLKKMIAIVEPSTSLGIRASSFSAALEPGN